MLAGFDGHRLGGHRSRSPARPDGDESVVGFGEANKATELCADALGVGFGLPLAVGSRFAGSL